MSRWIAAALVLIASPAAAAEERDFDTALRDFRVLHRSETSRARIAGSSFYVVRDGRTVAADHLGEQDADAHVPVDARTIYHWASITKTMTGIAIMQLRDRGLLSLDDPIVRYVPELAAVHNPYGDTGAITLRQLMSHSAGFRSGTWPWRAPSATSCSLSPMSCEHPSLRSSSNSKPWPGKGLGPTNKPLCAPLR